MFSNSNSLPKLEDSHEQECNAVSPKQTCLQSNQENEVNQSMLMLEEDCSKIPQEDACKEDPGLNSPNFDHSTLLIDKSLVGLFDKFLPPMRVGFKNLKIEMPNSYHFLNPSLSFETKKRVEFSPHYSSKLDLRIVSQDLNEFFDKCVVVLSNFILAHDNIVEGCVGIPKEHLFASLNTYSFVRNKVSTLRSLWNSKNLHVELIDDFTPTFLFAFPICINSLERSYDNFVVLEKVAMFGKEKHFVIKEENHHGDQCVLEPLQQPSILFCVPKFHSRKVNLDFHVNFKRYNILPSFKIPYLENIDVGSLTTKDAFGELSQFPFDPGGEFYNVFMALTCAYLHVGYVGAKFEVEFLLRGRA